MEFISILNDVLGPVMRGPSSSHTAGSYHIGRLLRSLLDAEPAQATFTFDPNGSYAATYRQQGVDLALTAGLLGWPITDSRFARALDHAARRGFRPRFRIAPLEGADHPNTVTAELVSQSGRRLRATARSVGGGMVLVTEVNGQPVRLDGKSRAVVTLGGKAGGGKAETVVVPPLFHVQKGEPLFASAAEMVALARRRHVSLGRIALAYESRLLGIPEADVLEEMGRRLEIMKDSVRRGLRGGGLSLKLLKPAAGKILGAEAAGGLPGGGLPARAAARSMAALHVAGSGGVVCAAPTGGSAGVLPGVMVTLAEEKGLDGERAALALLAAGGTASQAADAAAIALQNTMGSVCDLVQGMCEIPCHTRNAVAASSAFVCADLVVGGYGNPVPLDETIDASFSSGKMLPAELRCTAKGGLAIAPSALALKKRI